MPEIQFSHLAVVVDDIEAALAFWRDSLGLSLSHAHALPEESVDVAFLKLGEAQIELVQPTSGDSGVARYLAKRGPGLHHLCLEVPDLDAKLEQLRQAGCELINESPRENHERRYAFVHPKSAGGVLLELYEGADSSTNPAPGPSPKLRRGE